MNIKPANALAVRPVLILAMLLAFTAMAAPVLADDDEQSEAREVRLMFIGNSYTQQSRGAITRLLTQNSEHKIHIDAITPGGKTLKWHFENPKTVEAIAKGDYDYVILQDQSQTPALPGEYEKSFHEASAKLARLIRKSGAKPVFFLTWGRRDGDKQNAHLFPTYEAMQAKLTRAYVTAARRNKSKLAPVGEVWAAIRKIDPEFAKSLYKGDGSHPSDKGAHVVAATFLEVFEPGSIADCPKPDGFSEQEWEIVQRILKRMK